MANQMRLSGLISGMDTDSVISQLVAARQTKVDSKKKEQTKLSWKQDAYKELNSKLKSLQSKFVANMRFTSSYAIKKTTVSDSSVATVTAGSGAADSVQTLKVSKLAKSGYMTGGVVSAKDSSGNETGDTVTALSKMSDLGFSGNGSFQIKVGGNTVDIDVDGDKTISDVLTDLKNAGVNASFDETNQRFFINSKTSGAAANFTLSASDDAGNEALAALGLQTSDYYPAGTDSSKFATKINGEDAEIYLNGAKSTSSNNVFSINGLTITANKTTGDDEVTLTTAQDTSGIYDKIKSFLKEYNEIINQIDKLYGTKVDKDYEPLTDEEKEAMSESEIEKYEQKIKDGVLYRDSNLSKLQSTFTKVMSQGISVNGKTMYLSDFGIGTLSYFTSADYEKHALHINGDEDDENTSGNDDKLRAMITTDPDAVTTFFTELSRNLYSEMSDLSKSRDGYRTYGNFYDDKKMESDYKSYTTKISELEEKLNDYEDKLYSKFSKMETALAKLQSKSSALSSYLGT